MNKPWRWMHQQLFNTWYNTLLTLAALWTVSWSVGKLTHWAIAQAQWEVVQANLRLFFIGRYPVELSWRLWLIPALLVGLAALSWSRQYWPLPSAVRSLLLFCLWLLAFPAVLWLIGGGWGLATVSTDLWTGLLLTLLLAVVSTVLAFPFGVVLALGRQSTLPVLRWLSIAYIELIRGLPLIGILFLAQVMLPLFLPANIRLDRVMRAIAGLVIFNAAYLAENVRGGLQSIPRGQVEAANALGLNTPVILWFIVLPQALRAVIPAVVGQFISLFKDTSLLSIFALVELTGMSRSILGQPEFQSRYAEVYLFAALIYWVFCYAMSLASRRLEAYLRVGQS